MYVSWKESLRKNTALHSGFGQQLSLSQKSRHSETFFSETKLSHLTSFSDYSVEAVFKLCEAH